MPNSPNLALPYIAANQAQKHVPHNDAVAMIDGILQLSVVSRGLNAPPGTSVDGNRFLIGAAPTAEWLGQAGLIAFRNAGLWQFLTPRKGWALWVEAESIFLIFDGTNWVAPPVPQIMQNMTLLGVNATADATNKLAVSSSTVLLNNIGNGVQVKLNKNAATDTASLLYQTNFSGRAEMGTTGDDSFHFKVSPDGSTWKEGLLIDATTGLASVFANPTAALGIATKQYVDANVGGGGAPGGTAGQIQFKNGTVFGGFTASGDATINTTTGVVTISNGTVTLPKLANLAANSILGNNTGVAATPLALTPAQVKALLAITTIDVAGLGTLASASTVNLTTQSSGILPAAQFGPLTGDVATTAYASTIAANAVTNAKAAPMAALTFKGNTSTAAANPSDLTIDQMQIAVLNGRMAAATMIMN